MPKKMKDPRLFTLPCSQGDSKPTLADLGSSVNLIPLYLFKKLKIGLLEETDHVFRLKLLDDFYVIDMDKDPATPLLVGRGFLACKKAKIAVGEAITREWEIASDTELNPFKDVLVFRRMVEFLGVMPINLKGNMWELEELKELENRIDWNRPPKEGDEAWHAKIELIDPVREIFKKTFQSIPTTRKLFEKETPSEIIDLDHFLNS
ncbi:hypothetical protein Tco_1206163 [Tanacetum coccineum]